LYPLEVDIDIPPHVHRAAIAPRSPLLNIAAKHRDVIAGIISLGVYGQFATLALNIHKQLAIIAAKLGDAKSPAKLPPFVAG
jgi:hypothetical protein